MTSNSASSWMISKSFSNAFMLPQFQPLVIRLLPRRMSRKFSRRMMTTSDPATAEIPANKFARNPSGGWRGFACGAMGIAALALVAFWPALHGQFIWDDQSLVLKNPLVTGQLNLRNVWLQTDFSLTTVALWLQWLAWGNN